MAANNKSVLETVNQIKTEVTKSFEGGGEGTLLTNSHFENGRSLHSDQYYFLKKYFQNSANCKKLAVVLEKKLNSLKFSGATTLIGFRNYTSLLLNEITAKRADLNFAIIEETRGSYVWQHLPNLLHENLVIVLPIACTFVSYFKLRNFAIDYCEKIKPPSGAAVNKNFINIFMVLEESLRDRESEIIHIETLKSQNTPDIAHAEPNISEMYAAFNWVQITKDRILFNKEHHPDYVAHPLIRLYSKMWPPEKCPLCFPRQRGSAEEKPLFSTRDNFETPDLIFGFPNFRSVENRVKFIDAFAPKKYPSTVILKGHVDVDESSYSSYVRGNEFYLNNRAPILKFFKTQLKRALKDVDRVVFITAENKHNSTFLEELSTVLPIQKKSISILRFQPSNEFVDNFISLYFGEISDPSVGIIYFEDVMSGGKVFKLVSDYIKHARNQNGTTISQTRGVDLALTLVDRMPLYTRNEVVKKLSTGDHDDSHARLISYFNLNVPIVSPSHLGNPLQRQLNDLEGMIDQSHLDSLKTTIGKSVKKKASKSLPEIGKPSTLDESLHYFPFQSLENARNTKVWDLYHGQFNKDRLDLLGVHICHILNSELANKISDPESQSPAGTPLDFVIDLMDKVMSIIDPDLEKYFLPPDYQHSIYRKKNVEIDIVKDTIIKTLCQAPFVYHKDIYQPIFAYCLARLDELHTEIEKRSVKNFAQFRKLKFFIRRSIDLNSNFIVSERFLACIKKQYTKSAMRDILNMHRASLRNLEDRKNQNDTSDEFLTAAQLHVQHKIARIKSFFPDLLFYYKELIYRNPAISIQMESLLNSKDLLPYQIAHPFSHKSKIEDLIGDPYFHFTGMIKAENIYLLNELKDLHKRNLATASGASGQTPSVSLLTEYEGIRKHYFPKRKNDPVIVNAQKLLDQSRHRDDRKKLNEIKRSVAKMLLAVGKLSQRSGDRVTTDASARRKFNDEIKEILNSLVEILYSGMPRGLLEYAFFVQHSTSENPEGKVDSIYPISSRDRAAEPSAIKLRKDGLIYNLLQGLYDDADTRNEQTLIAGVKLGNGQVISFKDSYFLPVITESTVDSVPLKKSFKELYEADLYDNHGEEGVELLDAANMFLLFRVANFTSLENSPDDRLTGRAVLLVTSSAKSTTSNFVEFMSNEKVRLLLLIKEELLQYLKKQFDNDAFIDVLEHRNESLYQGHLRHGILDYIFAQQRLMQQIQNRHQTKANMTLFNIITRAIRGQVGATQTGEKERKKRISRQTFLTTARLIFETDYVGPYGINFDTVDVSDIDFNIKTFHPLILNVVIPELLINMKKYCPLNTERHLSIHYNKKENCFIFKNRVRGPSSWKLARGRKGQKMCNRVLESINRPQLRIQEANRMYEVKLYV